MTGTIGILNVGAGDTKLSFDKNNPKERKRAAKIVDDMLKRGYAVFVQVGEKDGEPLYQRAHAFNPETCEYLIFGDPEDDDSEGPKNEQKSAPRRRTAATPKRVAAEATRAVAVSRSAGG